MRSMGEKQMRQYEFKALQLTAYEHIKRKIMDGGLVFDTIYSETKVAQEIGISRTPVRDAVHMLFKEGLVDIIPNKGFILHKITEKDVMETFEIRSAIEGYCARKLASGQEQVQKGEILKMLESSIERQEKIFTAHLDVSDFVEEDMKFHELLVSGCDNQAFIDIFSDYMYWIRKLAVYSLHVEGRMESTIAEHREIVKHIREGNVQTALEAVLHHMQVPLDLNLESIYH